MAGRHPAILAVGKEDLSDVGEPPLDMVQEPSHLAYAIFTSGSTGQPKGMMIDHQGAVNTILDINRRFDVGAGDRPCPL